MLFVEHFLYVSFISCALHACISMLYAEKCRRFFITNERFVLGTTCSNDVYVPFSIFSIAGCSNNNKLFFFNFYKEKRKK